jgi:hypothetical protein
MQIQKTLQPVSRLSRSLLVAGLAGWLTVGLASAQSQPSAKVTAKTSAINLIPETTGTGDWVTILANQIRTPNQKDMFIGVSLEVGLFTRTTTRSKNVVVDTSLAQAQVEVRAMVDGRVAEPGVVVFGRRSQTLSATLEGAIAGCLSLVTNADGTVSVVVDPACVTPETIELILDTMDANAFNFVLQDLVPGVHTVSVQARIHTGTAAQQGTAAATATVGRGSMTVESVRLIRNEDVVDVP